MWGKRARSSKGNCELYDWGILRYSIFWSSMDITAFIPGRKKGENTIHKYY
jgi:hypothetical protein